MTLQSRRRRLRRGLTMTEVAISTVLVGLMVTASLSGVGTVFRMRRINATALTGPGLAQQLLEEAVGLPYDDPQNPGGSIGIDSGESSSTRATFDDVDDYNSWSSTDGQAKGGTAITGYTGWQCQFQVAWVQLAAPGTTSASDTGLKRIAVTVTSPSGVASTVLALRSRYGMLEQKPSVKSTTVNWLGAELKLGSGARPEEWGVRPANHANDAY